MGNGRRGGCGDFLFLKSTARHLRIPWSGVYTLHHWGWQGLNQKQQRGLVCEDWGPASLHREKFQTWEVLAGSSSRTTVWGRASCYGCQPRPPWLTSFPARRCYCVA